MLATTHLTCFRRPGISVHGILEAISPWAVFFCARWALKRVIEQIWRIPGQSTAAVCCAVVEKVWRARCQLKMITETIHLCVTNANLRGRYYWRTVYMKTYENIWKPKHGARTKRLQDSRRLRAASPQRKFRELAAEALVAEHLSWDHR